MANHVNEPVATPREENCSGKIAIEKPAADFWLFEAGKDQRQACHPNQEMPPGVRENREEEEPAERARPAPQPSALKPDSKAVEARRSPFSWARGAFGNPSALLRVFDFGQSGVGRFGRQDFPNPFGRNRSKLRDSAFALNVKIKTSSHSERITHAGQVQARANPIFLANWARNACLRSATD